MHSIVDLVTDLHTRPHPMLTWYGDGGERVDLTGKVTANWMIKATNLLTMEVGCEPGSGVWLDLPAHWRSLVWAHAAWAAGARLTLTSDDADVAITATPTGAHSHLETIVIALAALARRVEEVPPGAIDGAADLMTQADDFMLPPEGSASSPTGLGGDQSELLAHPLHVRSVESGSSGSTEPVAPAAARSQARVLVPGHSLESLLLQVPPLWAAGASVVISDEESSIIEAEGITHVAAH